ncbi:MAG: UTP--glucose-1-phosphate uridylyltransferase [Parachlamydiales bacterium]|nr:UTP--glucose-1-phosphate uridylyltransferase [Parachlamydiales bacterium]
MKEGLLKEKITWLKPLVLQLQQATSLDQKRTMILQSVPQHKISQEARLFLQDLTPDLSYAFLSLIALQQEKPLLQFIKKGSIGEEQLRSFLQELLLVESFYKEIGGIIGYHYKVLSLLLEKKKQKTDVHAYHKPDFCNISKNTSFVRRQVINGLKKLPCLCEFYVVGGAADRLHLCEEKTLKKLPASMMSFAGKTFLTTLIEDLQAKEYLYYKLFRRRLMTPICLMTSKENDNHARIQNQFEENDWFGRKKESIRFFIQPQVPTMTEEGEWCFSNPSLVLMKPGGHGVLWKLAKENGIFCWLRSQRRKKALVRQINNPVAGLDYGLLAFLGIGCTHNMRFGFASCPRLFKAAEGINVLIERSPQEFALTNIEYCDFSKYGICDKQENPESEYSQFPSNTNILFADLQAIEEAVQNNPFPGMLINAKPIRYPNLEQKIIKKKICRLESIMQNIADSFIEKNEMTKTFITYNDRKKTISTVKKVFHPEKTPHETPEKCFYDLLINQSELLNILKITHPTLPSFEQFIQEGPGWVFLYHPALGPLYSIIAQKMQKGILALGAELRLQIAEADIRNISLTGSLMVEAKDVMGHRGKNRQVSYSHQGGKCTLHHVVIKNQGALLSTENYWKGEYPYQEKCHILIEGNGEFYASHVTFSGECSFYVPKGYRMEIRGDKRGSPQIKMIKIQKPTWSWQYTERQDHSIFVKKVSY